ncbi:hypothetical protein [Wenyingzhuangia sp. IMCC45574]
MKFLNQIVLLVLICFSLKCIGQSNNPYNKLEQAIDAIFVLAENQAPMITTDAPKHEIVCSEVALVKELVLKMKEQVVELDFKNAIKKVKDEEDVKKLTEYYKELYDYIEEIKQHNKLTEGLCSKIGAHNVFKNQEEIRYVMELYYDLEELIDIREKVENKIKGLEKGLLNEQIKPSECEKTSRYLKKYIYQIKEGKGKFSDLENKAKEKYLALSTKQKNVSISTLSEGGVSIFEKFKSSLLKEKGVYTVLMEGEKSNDFNTSKLERLMETKLDCDKTDSDEQMSTTNEVKKNTACIKGDCENGYGVYIYSGGEKYVGFFKESLRDGEGIMYYSKESFFEGTFKNDELISGKKVYKDGSIQEGVFVNGRLNGEGIIIIKNGDRYEGSFINGLYHGHGVLKYRDGAKYIGEFSKGLRDGNGVFYQKDGIKCRCTYERGNIYSGKLYNSNGNLIYNGTFEDNNTFSLGTLYYSDGGRYKGPFENNKPHGYGKLYDKNGKLLYSGSFKNGRVVNQKKNNSYKIVPKNPNQRGQNLLSPSVQRQLNRY